MSTPPLAASTFANASAAADEKSLDGLCLLANVRFLKLMFEDHGPGIADIEVALRDGLLHRRRTGHGNARLEAPKQRVLCRVHPRKGTRVTLVRWKSR